MYLAIDTKNRSTYSSVSWECRRWSTGVVGSVSAPRARGGWGWAAWGGRSGADNLSPGSFGCFSGTGTRPPVTWSVGARTLWAGPTPLRPSSATAIGKAKRVRHGSERDAILLDGFFLNLLVAISLYRKTWASLFFPTQLANIMIGLGLGLGLG